MKKLTGELDAASWFDIFSILEIKVYSLETGEKRDIVLKNVEELWNCLEKQLGPKRLKEIYQSDEYNNLFKVNQDTFNAVELAEMDKISAKKVANLNNLRYFYKKAIQTKFFDGELSEVKVKY